jgi:hypothetical protein
MNPSARNTFINVTLAIVVEVSLVIIIYSDYIKTKNVIDPHRSFLLQTNRTDISISLPYKLIPTNQKFFIEVETGGAISSLSGSVNIPSVSIEKRIDYKLEGDYQNSGMLHCEIPNDSSLVGKEIKIGITALYYLLKSEGTKTSGTTMIHYFSKESLQMKSFTVKAKLVDFEKYKRIGKLNLYLLLLTIFILALIFSLVILFVKITMRYTFIITYFSCLVISYSYFKLKVFLLGIPVSLSYYGGGFEAFVAPLLVLLLFYFTFEIIAISQRTFSNNFHNCNKENLLRDKF